MATNRNTFIDNLEKDSLQQQKYKALHCKFPCLDMSANNFSPNRKNECNRMSPSRKQNSNADYKKFRLSSQNSRESYILNDSTPAHTTEPDSPDYFNKIFNTSVKNLQEN